jgi:hypothetical protein
MGFAFNVQRNEEDAILRAKGVIAAPAALELFHQIDRLIIAGYHLKVDLGDAEFVGLGAVRALKTASLRAEKAGVRFDLAGGPALYRVADLVGDERWSPLPRVSFEDDSVAV